MDQLITITLFGTHLALVQLASTAPIVCVVLRCVRSDRGRTEPLARRLAWHANGALFWGALLGLLLGWWLTWQGTRDYSLLLPPLSRKLWWSIWELLFYWVCMTLYTVWWPSWDGRRFPRVAHALLALLAASNLLYHFPVLLAIASQLLQESSSTRSPISLAEFRSLMISGPIASRSVHFIIAAVVVSGVWLIQLAAGNGRLGKSAPCVVAIRLGATLAVVGIALQVPVGMWVLTQVPAVEQARLLGAEWGTAAALASGVMISLWLLQHLANLAMEPRQAKRGRIALAATLAVIYLMSIIVVRGW